MVETAELAAAAAAMSKRIEVAARANTAMHNDVVHKFLFDKQRALADDPHRFVTACCGRRAGKTVAVGAMMLRSAKRHPRRAVLYATLTRANSKLIIWPTLKDLNRQFGLGGVPNEADLTMTMPNGAIIVLCGVDKRKEIEKRRGLGFALVVLDESQSIPEYVEELVDVVIGPALVDVPGKLIMIGTPSLLSAGYWYKCHHSENNVWGHHSWDMFSNPTIHNPEQSLTDELNRRGATRDDTSVQREWFARWVRDDQSAVFSFDSERNGYDPAERNTFKGLPLDLPREMWRYIISVDIGGGVARDNDAISVLAYHPQSRTTWLTEEHIDAKQDVTALSLAVVAIQKRLGAQNVSSIVADTGGIGAKVAEEMSRRHGLGVVAAKKADKWANIELLNAACRHGEFYAPKRSSFATECVKVEKDWAKSTPDRIAIKGHMPDICDSVLYGYVESLSWFSRIPAAKPVPGSEEWAKAQEKALFEHAQRSVRSMKNEADDFGGEMDSWGGGDGFGTGDWA